jgi:glycogen phosphorylase
MTSGAGTNNIANLLLSPYLSEGTKLSGRDRLSLLEEEPDAGLGNGGLGPLS